jgi:hypothetical protein
MHHTLGSVLTHPNKLHHQGIIDDAKQMRGLPPSRERSNHPGLVVEDDYCIINDKFPKARLHGLVIARDLTLEGPEDLRPIHLPLLQTMQVQ